jgi:hypothetical protein
MLVVVLSAMENSKALAKVIGPSLCVMSISEMINLPIWTKAVASVTYLNGIILFITGLYVVRIHNSWKPDWTILITLSAWLGMALGLFRVFFPEAKQAGPGIPTYILLTLLFTVGAILTSKSYGPIKHVQKKFH